MSYNINTTFQAAREYTCYVATYENQKKRFHDIDTEMTNAAGLLLSHLKTKTGGGGPDTTQLTRAIDTVTSSIRECDPKGMQISIF